MYIKLNGFITKLPLGPNWLSLTSINTSDSSYAELMDTTPGGLLEWMKFCISKILAVKVLESSASIIAFTSVIRWACSQC